eukprot:s977_g10.t1
MYIGVWPEYHLAKLVAKSDAGEDLPKGDLLPPFARVDVPDPAEAAQESYRRALESSRREQAARLPPIPPTARPARSLSKPSVWHPPLPESSPPQHRARHGAAAPRRTSSMPPTPPAAAADCHGGSGGTARPHSDRAAQRRRAAAAPRLAETPPWRELPPKPSGRMPNWIAQMREDVEATRQLFRGDQQVPRSFSLGKLQPLDGERRSPTTSPCKAEMASKEMASASSSVQGALKDSSPPIEAPLRVSQPPVPAALPVDCEEEDLIAWSQAAP